VRATILTWFICVLVVLAPLTATAQEDISEEVSCSTIENAQDLTTVYDHWADRFIQRKYVLVIKSADYVIKLTEVQQLDVRYDLSDEQKQARDALTNELATAADQLTTEFTRLGTLSRFLNEETERQRTSDRKVAPDNLRQGCRSDVGNFEEQILKSEDLEGHLTARIKELVAAYDQATTLDKLQPWP